VPLQDSNSETIVLFPE